MNIDKLKADLDRLNHQKQQTEQRARDLQARIQGYDRAQQTRRKIILGAWTEGMLNVEGARHQLRAFIQDKDKGLFPDLFTLDEIKAAKERIEAAKAEHVKRLPRKPDIK